LRSHAIGLPDDGEEDESVSPAGPGIESDMKPIIDKMV
jgi:hypothetical protein